MKEVTVTAFCDSDHDERVVAVVERIITIDGSKPVVLDMCGECDKSILSLLHLMENGAVLTAKAKKKADAVEEKKPEPEQRPEPEQKSDDPSAIYTDKSNTTCPDCGHTSTSRQGLGQHLRAIHNKGFRDLKVA